MMQNVDNQQLPELINFRIIKKDVIGKHPNHILEYEFVRRITMISKCLQREEARTFFRGKYSSPILGYVARYIYNNTLYQELLGEYYVFISKENKLTPYYKLTLYRNFNNSTLRNYITAITVRYFVSIKKKEDCISKKTGIPTRELFDSEIMANSFFQNILSSQYVLKSRMEVNDYKISKDNKFMTVSDTEAIIQRAKLIIYNEGKIPQNEYNAKAFHEAIYKAITETRTYTQTNTRQIVECFTQLSEYNFISVSGNEIVPFRFINMYAEKDQFIFDLKSSEVTEHINNMSQEYDKQMFLHIGIAINQYLKKDIHNTTSIMKLNNVIILNRKHMKEFFSFSDFWPQRKEFQYVANNDMFLKHKDQENHKNQLKAQVINWIENRNLTTHMQLGQTYISLPNGNMSRAYSTECDSELSLLKPKEAYGIVCLYELMERKLKLDIYEILACLGYETFNPKSGIMLVSNCTVKEFNQNATIGNDDTDE